MADETPIPLTEADVKDSNLLFRALKKVTGRLLTLGSRISSLEKAPPPLTVAEISRQLQASGAAPLNITQLPGVARQPQLAGAPRLSSTPTGLVLQQYLDTQLLLVGTTSTGFNLNAVVGGNPNTLYQLIQGLTTGTVTSTSTNLMTLDTVQTSTGAKTLQGLWTFQSTQGTVLTPGTVGPSAAFGNGYFELSNTTFFGGTAYGILLSTGGDNFFNCNSGKTLRFRVNNVEQATISTGGVTLTPKITQYDGVNTAAEGVPYLIARYTAAGQAAAVATTLYTTTTTGEYRINYYLSAATTGTSVYTPAYQFTDDLNTKTRTGTSVNLDGIQTAQLTNTLRCASGTAISFATSVGTSTVAPLGTYNVFVLLERLS